MGDRQNALLGIYREYGRCPAFARLRQPGWPWVPGRGSMVPRIVFVGEAPGEREQAARKPFVGPAGRVFAEMLAHVGIDRREVFVTNVIKYRPVQGSVVVRNRTPTMSEQVASWPFLRRELNVFGPDVPWIAMGRVAVTAICPPGRHVIGAVSGTGWYDATRAIGAIYHPAVAVYDPAMKPTLLTHIGQLVDWMTP